MLRVNVSAKQVFFFWGVLDAIYILRYVVLCFFDGRIPYFQDFKDGLALLVDHGGYAHVMAIMVWGVELSIILSCFLFLTQQRGALWLAWFQIPFRLILVVPSVSIIFMGADLKERYGLGLMLLLLALSELLKGWTLWKVRKSNAAVR